MKQEDIAKWAETQTKYREKVMKQKQERKNKRSNGELTAIYQPRVQSRNSNNEMDNKVKNNKADSHSNNNKTLEQVINEKMKMDEIKMARKDLRKRSTETRNRKYRKVFLEKNLVLLKKCVIISFLSLFFAFQ